MCLSNLEAFHCLWHFLPLLFHPSSHSQKWPPVLPWSLCSCCFLCGVERAMYGHSSIHTFRPVPSYFLLNETCLPSFHPHLSCYSLLSWLPYPALYFPSLNFFFFCFLCYPIHCLFLLGWNPPPPAAEACILSSVFCFPFVSWFVTVLQFWGGGLKIALLLGPFNSWSFCLSFPSALIVGKHYTTHFVSLSLNWYITASRSVSSIYRTHKIPVGLSDG